MPKVRDLSKSAGRLQTTGAARSTEYLEGVSGNTDWAANAVAAQPNYDAGVQEAVAKKSFSRGVQKAGQGKFNASAEKIGQARFAQGIAIAGPEWEKGFAPFKAVIEGVSLPKRGRRGDPSNWDRAKAVGMALAKKRQELKGG